MTPSDRRSAQACPQGQEGGSVRRRTQWGAATAAALVLVAGAATVAAVRSPAPVAEQAARVPVGPEPDGTTVEIDTTVFRPDGAGPFPSVLLAHGFGGSKADEADDARDLAQHGFLVVTWSARGFGASGGRIHLDSPDYEVRDASALVDLLGARPDVQRDGPGDPRVGVVGASYGGGLALLLAGTGRRIDAVVPAITWNGLGGALFPQSAASSAPPAGPASVAPIPTPGVFKQGWAGQLFASAVGTTADPACGRFDPAGCAAYQASATAGAPTPALQALMAASSPARVLARITAPTLLIQGEADTLFPLREADANARGIAAAGTPVRLVWYGGGHDGGAPETERLRGLTRGWLDGWLRRGAPPTGPASPASVVTRASDGGPDLVAPRSAPGLPGVTRPGPVP
ncbi:MAG: alpha/beta fold hydrolase, partial [Rhodoferax sp.]|nr:alpha/beta fold hydrolase [Actinomycetota bacterium]